MTARTRTRSGMILSGSGYWYSTPVSWSRTSLREKCDDVIGDYGGNHSLTLKREQTTGSMYVRSSGNLILPDPGVPSGWHDELWGDWSPQPTLSSYTARVLAQTGPLTPKVNLPLFIFELKDIPQMLRHAGNLLHKIRSPSGLDPVKEAAAANLAYKFGWEPLISDLGKLLNFADHARKRQDQLKKAYSSRGVRRKVTLDELSKSVKGSSTVWSVYGSSLSAQWSGLCTSQTWATVRWIVRDPNQYGYSPTFTEGFKTALGLNPGMVPITVWKALPWSWMIDWFTDISNVMLANYNSIYFKPYRLSIMRTSVTTVQHKSIPKIDGNEGNFLTAGTRVTQFKYRYANNAPSANVTLRLPFMDSYKMSVLGSLAALKVLK